MIKKALIALTILGHTVIAQETDTTNYYDLDLMGLFNLEVETASKKKESVFDSPLSTSIITKEEIKMSGATTIEELFRLVPGLIVREITNGNFDAHIRGFDNLPPSNFTFYANNSISLVMVDGRAVYNDLNGGTFWEAIPVALTDIEKIEIVRGPNSALYGPNAASGVINIITSRENSNKQKTQVVADFKGGNMKTNTGNISLKFEPTERLYFSISGSADLRDRGQTTYYNYFEEDYTKAEELRDYQGGFVLTGNTDKKWPDQSLSKQKYGSSIFGRYKFGESSFIDASVGYHNTKVQTVFMESTTTPILPRHNEGVGAQFKLKHNGLNIQWDGNFGNGDVQPGWSNIGAFDYQKNSGLAEYEFKPIKNLNIRPGVSYQNITYSDLNYVRGGNEGKGILNATQTLEDLAYFIKADYTLKDKIRFVFAGRNDHHTRIQKQIFSFQGAMIFLINESQRLRLSIGKSNRAPFMADMFATFNSGGAIFKGNTDMDLMTVFNREIGYRIKLQNKIEIDLESFWNTSSNYSGLKLEEFTFLSLTYKYNNFLLEAEQFGGSATIAYQASKSFNISAFGTIQHTQLTNYEELQNPVNLFSGVDTIDTKYTNTPGFYGGFKSTYHVGKLSVFTNGYFMGEHRYWYRITKAKVSDKFRLDASINYAFSESISAAITGRNILNSNKTEFGLADQIGGLYLIGFNVNF